MNVERQPNHRSDSNAYSNARPTMAVFRAHTAAATLFLVCIASSVKSFVAWVFPLQPRTETTTTTTTNRRNLVCYLSSYNNENVYASEATNDGTNVVSWDDQVIRWVDGILELKAESSPFVSECPIEKGDGVVVPHEWIAAPYSSIESDNNNSQTRKIALRTTGEPLLDAESISKIRQAAENLWERQKKSEASSSRFTLQYKDTNSECHLEELVNADNSGELRTIVDNLLTKKVYPLVRSAFEKDDRYGLTDGSLCVYDSLIVRYNGDKAANRFGASQPLHGDGGVVSVNIALNAHRDTDEPLLDTFSGGGTFFEDLIDLDDDDVDHDPILRPSSTGHALAHWSTHRHAGAPTLVGTRDILVFFLTQNKATQQQQQQHQNFNGIERSFQLKLKARELPNEQRGMTLRCLDLAIDNSPFDAQAHFWKGFNLIQGGQANDQQRWEELCQAIHHLERAKNCAPFDAKISCYVGMAYRQRWMFAQQENNYEQDQSDIENATEYLERALLLYENYCKHGISSDFDDNANTARITLGEVYLQQERYDTAVEFLTSAMKEPSLNEPMRQHISKLIGHTREQLEQGSEKTHGLAGSSSAI